MNFDFNDANINPISKEEILSKISEYYIFKKYIHNFIELDVSFMSELRTTDTANCRVTDKYNSLVYKDFKSGDSYDCWNYVMKKYYCSFRESLNIIATDFNIRKLEYKNEFIPVGIIPNSIKTHNVPREKSKLVITKQNWNIIDYDFWNSFGSSLNLLDIGEVYSAKSVQLLKNGQRYCYFYKKNNPIYIYNEYDIDLNFLGYRVYFPFGDKNRKWLNNSSGKAIQGIKLLPEKGQLLILTKSMKDVLTLYGLGYNAISLASETTSLMEYEYNKLINRFDNIISLYDNDETGIKYSQNNLDMWNIFYTFMPEYTNCKDVSDLYKKVGKEECKKILKKLLCQI